jgi:hypothetical protein
VARSNSLVVREPDCEPAVTVEIVMIGGPLHVRLAVDEITRIELR